jgi:hypothetical protein
MSNDLLLHSPRRKAKRAAHPVGFGPQKDELRSKGKMVKGSKRSEASSGTAKTKAAAPMKRYMSA